MYLLDQKGQNEKDKVMAKKNRSSWFRLFFGQRADLDGNFLWNRKMHQLDTMPGT